MILSFGVLAAAGINSHPLPVRLYRSQGIQTQHLLGHKNQEMTDKYNDDRGLSAAEWKHLAIPGSGQI